MVCGQASPIYPRHAHEVTAYDGGDARILSRSAADRLRSVQSLRRDKSQSQEIPSSALFFIFCVAGFDAAMFREFVELP